MSTNWGKAGGEVKSQVDDRIGRFRWIADRASGQELFDLELNAFETGCVMRWLERRWSRGAELAGACFVMHNNSLHVQFARTGTPIDSGVPIGFESWVRRLARLAAAS